MMRLFGVLLFSRFPSFLAQEWNKCKRIKFFFLLDAVSFCHPYHNLFVTPADRNDQDAVVSQLLHEGIRYHRSSGSHNNLVIGGTDGQTLGAIAQKEVRIVS